MSLLCFQGDSKVACGEWVQNETISSVFINLLSDHSWKYSNTIIGTFSLLWQYHHGNGYEAWLLEF